MTVVLTMCIKTMYLKTQFITVLSEMGHSPETISLSYLTYSWWWKVCRVKRNYLQ